MNSIPVHKMLQRTQLDLENVFPKNHACAKRLAALLCGLAVLVGDSALHQEFEEVGKTS